jgi:hypothetical protein
VKDQDNKIQGLHHLTAKYESELYKLKIKNNGEIEKHGPMKHDYSGHNILNTTDNSSIESPFTDHSGHAPRDSKPKGRTSPYISSVHNSQNSSKIENNKKVIEYNAVDPKKKVSSL